MNISEWVKLNLSANDWIAVTGASSGIGLEYMKALSKAGCNVIAISNERDRMELEGKKVESEYGNKIEPVYCDLSKYNEIVALGEMLKNRNCRGLINNAGFGLKGRFESHPAERYRDIIAVNSLAPTILTHALLPSLQETGKGLLILVASINAITPIPFNQVYSATKSFAMNMFLAVARENRNSDICFQLVLPGTTLTPFHEKQGASPASLMMTPDVVVARSLNNIDRQVCIPNRADTILPWLVRVLPRNKLMDLASYMVKKRLGLI